MRDSVFKIIVIILFLIVIGCSVASAVLSYVSADNNMDPPEILIGTQSRSCDKRVIVKIPYDDVESVLISVYAENYVDNIKIFQDVEIEDLYDSFYNDGELVTASDLHCKSFAILEIGNPNPWDDIVVTATIMPENVALTKVIK